VAAVTGAAMESKRREDFNELMATIVNSIPDGVHCVDAAGKITAINAAARRMYGYAEAEIVASSSEMLLPVGQRDEIRRLHQRALDGEIVARFPMLQVRSDGAEIPVLMTILPMRHGGEAIANVAFIATAIGKTAREAGIASARDESHPPRHASASALTVH
jgi:PAS domain S-box-containing protein